MEIIIVIFFIIFIGFILIKLWLMLVNFIMNPLIKKAEEREKRILKEQKYFTFEKEEVEDNKEQIENNIEILKIEKEIQNFNNSEKSTVLGVFHKINHIKPFIPEFQLKYITEEFYFKNYYKKDGEWINKGDILCYVFTSSNDSFKPIYSHKSGYLEHLKKYGQKLFENDKLSIIHNEGEYENENSPLKVEYRHYDENNIDKWFVSDGNFIKINDSICQYENSNDKTQIIKAKKEGFIDIEILETKHSIIYEEYLLFTIRENDTIRQNKKYKNIPNIILDDFTNSKIIKWKEVSSFYPKDAEQKLQGITSKSDNHLINLFFTFNYMNNNDYIVFHYNPKQIRPFENDKIIFLFENNEKIEFNLNRNPIYLKNNKFENVLESKFIITKQELDLFANNNFKKWKLILKKEENEILGGDFGEINNYKSKLNLKIVIKKFANDYIKIVNNEVDNYKPTEIRIIEKTKLNKDEICFVYLMQDTSNNYFKIGISNKPKYREKTLQSEKPTIELLKAKKFPIRKIAESFEKALHETYSEKRIRGEWFNLSEKDVENIIIALS